MIAREGDSIVPLDQFDGFSPTEAWAALASARWCHPRGTPAWGGSDGALRAPTTAPGRHPTAPPPAAWLPRWLARPGVRGGEVVEELGGLRPEGVQVEVPVPDRPRPGGRADLLGVLLHGLTRGWGRRPLRRSWNPGPGQRVEMGPTSQHPERGGSGPGARVPQVGERPPGQRHEPAQAPVGVGDRLAPRWAARRSASSAASGMRAGSARRTRRHGTTPWRRSGRTCSCRPAPTATGPSDGCRPATLHPGTPKAIDNGNHVIDVGSATATAPG